MTKPQIRCAVYTRKSSDEGLEQSFNSLDAQREACVAYIQSQKHEGWIAVKEHYDDGGFSGGSIERPALKQLLDHIVAGRIETVIVYKVDRLTRSLADFAKIIEVFDSHKVSFVSVTQQFNTTTSMGRLTLNVLLSFAQFERELTGERIRDKVAASKKKGMWMGGVVPLGYDCVKHCLVVNEKEAQTVREIFQQYLRLGCVRRLKAYLEDEQIRSKVRTSKDGRTSGGAIYSRGALYHLLNNRVYIGEIVHRDQSYQGQHEAILPRTLWDEVAEQLRANDQAHRTKKTSSTPSLLSGIVFDVNGVRFTPTHAVKNGKRYRYYTSQAAIHQTGTGPVITRFPAQELESLVTSQIHLLLRSPDKCTVGLENGPEKDLVIERALDLAQAWHELEISKQHEFVRRVSRRIVVGRTTVCVEVDRDKLLEVFMGNESQSVAAGGENKSASIKLRADFRPLRRGSELRLVGPEGSCYEGIPIHSLVRAVARARDWYERIVAGQAATVGQLARETGLSSSYVKRVLKCAMLSPQITESILSGNHRPNLTLQELLQSISIDWQIQRNVSPP